MRAPTVLTVRNLPREISVALARRARERGISLNRAALELLAEAVQPAEKVAPPPRRTRHDDLDAVIGVWTARDQAEFDGALAEQRRVDPADW